LLSAEGLELGLTHNKYYCQELKFQSTSNFWTHSWSTRKSKSMKLFTFSLLF